MENFEEPDVERDEECDNVNYEFELERHDICANCKFHIFELNGINYCEAKNIATEEDDSCFIFVNCYDV